MHTGSLKVLLDAGELVEELGRIVQVLLDYELVQTGEQLLDLLLVCVLFFAILESALDVGDQRVQLVKVDFTTHTVNS
jgi:hypothetical protein